MAGTVEKYGKGWRYRAVVGIDPVNRFGDAGVKLAAERNLPHLHFLQADGMYLPFAEKSFDLVLSHAVIEHVVDAPLYLRECRRVMAPGARHDRADALTHVPRFVAARPRIESVDAAAIDIDPQQPVGVP